MLARPTQPLLPADSISHALDAWFRRYGKTYPWRETHDPYAIAVSELMLQQTQIKTVLERGYYHRWMAAFPNLQKLSEASEDQILSVWQGLGYYRRARFLHAMAKHIVQHHAGKFPSTEAEIRQLPGIGDYTSGAIRSFAFNQPAALVDGNVARVLSRLCNDPTPIDTSQGIKLQWERAKALMDFAVEPRVHNSALMELGQQICRPGVPLCSECPLNPWCKATAPENLPIKAKKTVITEVDEHVAWIVKDSKLLLHQETGARRKGLWKLPSLETPSDSSELLLTSSYAITRYKVKLHVYKTSSVERIESEATLRWFQADELRELPMPSPYRKVAEKLWLDLQEGSQSSFNFS